MARPFFVLQEAKVIVETTKVIGLRVDLAFARELRMEAARRDLSRSAFIRQTLSEKLVELKQQRSAQPAQQTEGGGGG